MNKSPSQRLTTFIDTIRDKNIPHSALIRDLKVMRDQFQKEEAEAYRGLQGINKYYGVKLVNELLAKSDKLTGRKM